MRFYFDDEKLFALVKLDEQYQAPINVNPDVVVSKSTEEDYLLFIRQTRMHLYLGWTVSAPTDHNAGND